MARLIDADSLLEKIQFRLPIDNRNAEIIAGCVNISRRYIENEPTVDAVEVVRCFCCKEWVEIEDTFGAGYCHHPCWLLVGYEPPIVQAADFCSYGERRTDA